MSQLISAAFITFNEGHRLHRGLESVIGIVDEVVIIDSFSSDNTIELAKSYQGRLNIKIIEREFEGYIEQKNFAISQCSHDYILSLDGDEAIDEELQDTIIRLKDFSQLAKGYYFRRLTNYNGYWVKHCGWYPDRKLRLFHKSHAKWTGANPHDIISMSSGSDTKEVSGNILHYSYQSISDHVAQTNKFTTIAAKAAFASGKRSGAIAPIFRGILKFFRDYLLKLGFMDGRYGLIICTINSLYVFLKYSKINELGHNKTID